MSFTPESLASVALRANTLDEMVTRAALYTEKAVARAPYGKPWSIKLASLGREITFWKARKRDFLDKDNAYIRVSVDEMHWRHINVVQHNNLDFIRSQLDNAWKELRFAQLNAEELRQTSRVYGGICYAKPG
jgi:hypothetical protein